MMQLPAKIGKVEVFTLVKSDEFADVPAEEFADWINKGHTAIKMAVRRLAIHVACKKFNFSLIFSLNK